MMMMDDVDDLIKELSLVVMIMMMTMMMQS